MFTLRDIARSHMDSDIRIAIYWRSDLAEVWLSAGFGWAEIKSREWRLLTRDEAFGGDGVAIARQRMPRVAAVPGLHRLRRSAHDLDRLQHEQPRRPRSMPVSRVGADDQ